MSKERRNEMRKLRASGFNAIATSFITVGVLTPLVAYYLDLTPKPIPLQSVIVVIGSTFGGSLASHLLARQMLRRYE